jgi:hypothetical protein
MADGTAEGRPGHVPPLSEAHDRAQAEKRRPEATENNAKSGPRLVGPEDEERRGGVPGLESDD